MKKSTLLVMSIIACLMTACGNETEEIIMTVESETSAAILQQESSETIPQTTEETKVIKTETTEILHEKTQLSEGEESEEATEMKMKITVNGQELTATLYDNSTAKAFAEQIPATLPMLDLYGREMCYRFPNELPTDDVQYTGYEVGEIVYWPPRHSFVIMYAQNGEQFEMQKVGRIDSGVEIFDGVGDIEVSFEFLE
ncbi:MAG: cyclophilin-like fold protein [Ruminococcus flavefaciens]|nr:cyclophilin-like fold protein [Ruminococcus flavefaciens]MCM1060970.1 cyclophilin-like fold protein [Eubacterium sp.]